MFKKVIALSSILFTCAAHANPPEASGEHGERVRISHPAEMNKADFIARANERAGKVFERIDSNKDGAINQDERKAAHQRRVEMRQGK